jgi:plasmid stabilization system protein ParE
VPGRELLLEETAIADLAAIADYIIDTAGLPRTAQAYVDRIEQRCRGLLLDFPLVGRDASGILPGLRLLVFEGVVIAYRVEGDLLRILRVLRQARDYESVLRESNRP